MSNKYKLINLKPIIKDLKTFTTIFVNVISKKYKIDVNNLNMLLNNITFINENTCQHLFNKGKNDGKMCENKVSLDSKTGKYCGKHLLDEVQQPKKVSSKVKKIQQQAEHELNVIKKLNDNKPLITIRRNTFGNYEHEDTELVMNRETRKIIGKQMSDGSISVLTSEDIEMCKLWKFSYDLPSVITSINNN